MYINIFLPAWPLNVYFLIKLLFYGSYETLHRKCICCLKYVARQVYVLLGSQDKECSQICKVSKSAIMKDVQWYWLSWNLPMFVPFLSDFRLTSSFHFNRSPSWINQFHLSKQNKKDNYLTQSLYADCIYTIPQLS